MRVRGQMPAGKMNRTESAYGAYLRARVARGEIAFYAFEPLKLRLADKTYYSPDFLVMGNDGVVELHEVKGFWRDDARVKVKVAAEMFPIWQFVAVTRKPGGWNYERF